MVKLSHILALTAGLCLYTAQASVTTDLPDLPDISSLLGGGLYNPTKNSGGGGGSVTNPSTDDKLTDGEDVDYDGGSNDNGTGSDDSSNGDDGEVITVKDPTTVANPFPKGGISIHKSNKSSKNNKDGGTSVSVKNRQGAGKSTTSTYLRKN